MRDEAEVTLDDGSTATEEREVIIAAISRSLNSFEQNYSSFDGEIFLDSALPQAPLEKPSRWRQRRRRTRLWRARQRVPHPPARGRTRNHRAEQETCQEQGPTTDLTDAEDPRITLGCDPSRAKANHPHRGAQAC